MKTLVKFIEVFILLGSFFVFDAVALDDGGIDINVSSIQVCTAWNGTVFGYSPPNTIAMVKTTNTTVPYLYIYKDSEGNYKSLIASLLAAKASGGQVEIYYNSNANITMVVVK